MPLKLPVKLSGQTEPFQGDGRRLGYPTANLSVETDLTDGVYFGFADLAAFKNHPALVFVGVPTTMGEHQRRVEAHLLDIPDENYYGQKLKLNIRHYHRSNKKFADIATLKDAMLADEAAARGWFAVNKVV